MLAANVGVIAGIIFLGYEIQQNNDQLQSQSRASVHSMHTEIQRALYENAGGLADAMRKSIAGDPLTSSEPLQIAAFIASTLRTMEFMFQEDPEYLRANSGWVILYFSNLPGLLELYDRTRDARDSEFKYTYSRFITYIELLA